MVALPEREHLVIASAMPNNRTDIADRRNLPAASKAGKTFLRHPATYTVIPTAALATLDPVYITIPTEVLHHALVSSFEDKHLPNASEDKMLSLISSLNYDLFQ